VTGPYFPDQQPSECGHYYPDVLRLRDERRADGSFVRLIDCSHCGRYELPLDLRELSAELRRTLQRTGRDIAIEDEEIATKRKKLFEEMLG
jgi:hypothetical protein